MIRRGPRTTNGQDDLAPNSGASGRAQLGAQQGGSCAPTSGARRSGALASAMEVAIISLVALAAWGARPAKPSPSMPHVNVCHPNVCFLTKQAHDEYACQAGCEWDDPLDAENDTVIQFEAKALLRFENNIHWMYKDSNGYVTVGIGHLIMNATDAESLPFYNRDTGKPATKLEIDAAFNAVNAALPGLNASKYENLSNLSLGDADIQDILSDQLEGFTEKLNAWFPDYENYPAKARAALLDMAYNPGNKGLLRGWPRLVNATKAYDWVIAGGESARHPVNIDRNRDIRQWFNDAAAWESGAVARQALCGVQPPDAGDPTIAPAHAAAKPAAAVRPVPRSGER